MPTKKTAAVYIRVSTDKQEELSPASQRRMAEDYARQHNLFIPEEYIFIENGISGRKADKRPEFLKMIAHAKSDAHPFDTILVWKFSRFARNQEESIFYKSMLQKFNVNVVSISEPIVEGQFGKLIERIIEWWDEFYSVNLAQEVRRGMEEKAKRGGYQAATPLGYIRPAGSEYPVIDEKSAGIIRYIFSSYLKGSDFSSIARNLNDKGYTTKQGNPFELRTVKYILSNPFYTGKIRWNRAPHGEYHDNPEEDIIIANGKHEPIIDEDTFRKVQDKLKHEFRPARRKGTAITKHWLCGVLKCGYCHSSLTYFQNQKHTQGNFQCYKYAKGVHRESCAISRIKAENMVFDFFEGILNGNSFAFQVAEEDLQINKAAIQKQLQAVDKKLKRAKDAYLAEIDTLEEYNENKKALLSEKEQLEAELATQAAPVDMEQKRDELLIKLKDVYQIITDDNATIQEKGDALRKIVRQIIYDKESQTMSVELYIS